MSVNSSYLDIFPVEIIDLIFDYLSTIDIIHGFLKLSPYINDIVRNYHFYQINFHSIVKNDFDLICDNIKSNQVKSLILSDGIDTPFQSNLFFSLFQMEEFSLNLCSLSLIDINDQSMELIRHQFDQLKKLSSLTIRNSDLISPSTLQNIFPQLHRLNISSECFFQNLIQMNQLEHLILTNQSSFNQFETIINYAPKLVSLKISLERESGGNIHTNSRNLTRLIIDMSNSQMNFIQMKDLLNCFPSLLHFEIECRTDLDLCDGYQWELYLLDQLPHLKTFNFKFQLKPTTILNIIGIENILRSYSSLFWFNEKHWFIAIEWEQRLIYTVPRYSCESADPNFRPPIHSTSLDHSIYYDHINALAIWGEITHRFLNVKEVWLVDNPSRIQLESIIDVNRVEQLIFVTSKTDCSMEILISLLQEMKNLNFIQFYSIPMSFDEYKDKIVFRQIRSIKLMKDLKSFSLIKTLNKLFPEIERLHMKIKSNEEIWYTLKSFSKSLSIVKFDCDTSILSIRRKFIQKILGHSNFTYSIETDSIRLWIGSNKSSNHIQCEEKKNLGCFSWCSPRKFVFKR